MSLSSGLRNAKWSCIAIQIRGVLQYFLRSLPMKLEYSCLQSSFFAYNYDWEFLLTIVAVLLTSGSVFNSKIKFA